MTKLKQLIGAGRAIFASALCLPTEAMAAAGLLFCVLLAPSAWAKTYILDLTKQNDQVDPESSLTIDGVTIATEACSFIFLMSIVGSGTSRMPGMRLRFLSQVEQALPVLR